MADPYPYPVFFECSSLDGEEKKRLENYFHIRRKSGGGECSSVTNVIDKVYKVAFKEREAQQRVLQRSKHVLKFAGGPMVLIVQGHAEPDTCSPVTTSTTANTVSLKLDSTSSQQQSLVSSVPVNGKEYELQLDPYLLRYLKECPKAVKELEEELASVASSALLFPDDEKVLVRKLTQPGGADEVRNWKAEVDKIFDVYQCHYEVNPHKVKALLLSCRSGQTTDEVKVYSEVEVAVVVGKTSQVNAKLADVDNICVQGGLRLNERQTSVRRLGKAKLGLLWKDIEHSVGRDFPGVKVTQGDAGQLVLEGSVEEILKAGNLITEKENLVLERTVSDMSPHFLAFLKKAYGEPGLLGAFLGVGDNVEIELRDTELRFFTLSADKLDDTGKKLQDKFKEVKINVPNCSAVPSELKEKLKSEMSDMNQVQYRAQVVFGSDHTLCLMGHTTEVEELNEVVAQFILDHLITEGKVILPFPELVQFLPELLALHKFDYSGITFCPSTSSSGPEVMLQGPANKVTQVRNRLGPFLDSLVQDRVTIDLPGAARYFKSNSGRDDILRIARTQRCLIQLQEQAHPLRQNLASGATLIKGGTIVSSYCLCDGLQVVVCHGDITKQHADALVNAANEDLDHCGGVAAALSKAGGPEVQRESKVLVKQTGKIPTGEVVVTTGGKLNCKKLLHAVGPVAGKAGGMGSMLLKRTVQSALMLAETMEFQSIAIPCISSGIFGVPVLVCSEAIVTAVKEFSSQGGRSLSKIILIDNREEVVRAMHKACDRLLQGINIGNSVPAIVGLQDDSTAGAAAGTPGDGVRLEIIQGAIETQQVDGLVSPMAGHNPLSSRVGNDLSNVVGPQMTVKFNKEAGGATLPGDIVLVEGLPALQSKGVFFLNLVPWDSNPHGTAVQALRQGIRKILASCQIRCYSSVAFPVLGTGAVLHFPHSTVSRVVLEEVAAFEQKQESRRSLLVRIVIHPNDKESSKAFQSAQETVHLRGFTNNSNPDKASFYRHVSITNDEVTAMLGGVKLQLVFGDIIHERTDAVINTTDFSTNQSGVSKAILTAAGPTVQAELAQVGIPANLMCTTGPGLLGCKEIIHASFHSNPQLIRKNCKKILKQCENKGYQSAAFPAINTGAGGMDAAKACKAMLDGMTSAIIELKPKSVSLIRIVIFQQPIFQAFRSEVQNRFGQTADCHLTLTEKARQKLKKLHDKISQTLKSSAPQDKAFITIKPKPAVLSVISCSSDTVRTVKRELEEILQKQLVKREVDVLDFSRLDDMEQEAVQAKVKVSEISMEYSKHQSSVGVHSTSAGSTTGAEASDQPGSGGDIYVLKGLKEDVLGVTELINRAIQKALCKDLQDKEEAMLALSVQWLIQDENGALQEFSLHSNYLLEKAYKNKQPSVNVTTPHGIKVKVNLNKHEATNGQTGNKYEVKRTEAETILEMPRHWQPMQEVEVFKKVNLQPNSQEYKDVAQRFHQTANFNILTIERVQNIYLWYAYSVCRQRLLAKNGSAELGEMFLYHGTSAKSCDCIEKGGFDRGFAGKHAARFGQGVYFAVNADYSARGFSPADASGLKRLYVARVLTGRYTVGNRNMKVLPPRNSDPTDCFDSSVDQQQQPTMFVIYHDDQAYPEYLITFT